MHEKSILLPLLPASLLAIEEPFYLKWMMLYALFSMFPLLYRDKLILPYIALSALFLLLFHARNRRQDARETKLLKAYVTAFFLLCAFILHIVYLTMQAPHRYPFLFEALIMLLSFSQFVILVIYSNAKQWMLKRDTLVVKEKKLLWTIISEWYFILLMSEKMSYITFNNFCVPKNYPFSSFLLKKIIYIHAIFASNIYMYRSNI